jgi:hypothetical protein
MIIVDRHIDPAVFGVPGAGEDDHAEHVARTLGGDGQPVLVKVGQVALQRDADHAGPQGQRQQPPASLFDKGGKLRGGGLGHLAGE